MRSLSLVRMPCFRRCSMISTTSPNHEGVEGTECEEVWMLTEESAILVMCTSLLGKMCILPQERHILCLLATNYISLRNSWEWMRGPCACPGWGATILPHGTPTNRRARRTSTRPNTFQIGTRGVASASSLEPWGRTTMTTNSSKRSLGSKGLGGGTSRFLGLYL